MEKKLRERLEAVRVLAGKAMTQTEYTSAGEKAIRLIPELLSILDAEGDGGAVVTHWIEGSPDKVYASEWFIAQTTNRERVVLTALPEEYAYDFKTADETYTMRLNIKRWMQFPDSQFIPYTSTHPARSGVVSDEDVEAAIEAHNTAIYRNGNNRKLAMRAALEHFAKGEQP